MGQKPGQPSYGTTLWSFVFEPNVPDEYVILNFKTWDDMAESAGISRIYGGIHYPSSNTIALETGKMIAIMLLGKK